MLCTLASSDESSDADAMVGQVTFPPLRHHKERDGPVFLKLVTASGTDTEDSYLRQLQC